MAENVPNKTGDTKTPPTTEKPIAGTETPNIDGKQTPDVPDIPPNLPDPQKQADSQEQTPPVENPKEQEGKGKLPEPKKPETPDKKNPQRPKKEVSNKKPPAKKPEAGKKPTPKADAEKSEPSQPEPPAPSPEPRAAPGSEEKAEIVFLNLSDLYPFKDHPFQVKQDEEIEALVETVKDKGVTNPITVRPREGGGYEIVSGHRRMLASELAGFTNAPCIVRNLTDEQAITQMVEDNTTQREQILPSERAKALKMQLDAIKRQGARDEDSKGQRSNEVVAKRNKMTVKTVQRYIKLNELVPDLMKMVDDKKMGFTTAVELAFISPKNQRYIAVAIEGQQSAPSLSQAQRMRELDQQKILKPDTIDGIMLEEKKEVDKVIISSQELAQFFGKDKTPREMKDKIMALLEEHVGKKEITTPEQDKDK